MAAVLQSQNEVCRALMDIETMYINRLYSEEEVYNVVILMATTYLTNRELAMGCFTTTRTTQTSRNATLLSLIQEFYHKHESGLDLKESRLGRMLPDVVKTALLDQYEAVNDIESRRIDDVVMAESKTPDEMDVEVDHGMQGGKRRKKGGKKLRGGFFSEDVKRGFANVIIAGGFVAGIAAYKTGALYSISKYLVTYFSSAFVDDSHCISNLGYVKNAMMQFVPGGGVTQSCSAIFQHNNATADWIVSTTASLFNYVKVTGGFVGVSLFVQWGRLQDQIIKRIINPLDGAIDYMIAKLFDTPTTTKSLNDFKQIIIKNSAIKKYTELQAQAQLAAGVQPGQGDTHPNAELRQLQQISDNIDDEEERRRAPNLYYNKSVDSITFRDVATLTISDRGVEDTHKLLDPEKLLYYKTIQEYMRAQADSSSTSGGKKKRKTMKKKRRHKKRVRKSGKKKIHKKKGKKTVKKHHKKHQKKRNKKHARKTRKH